MMRVSSAKFWTPLIAFLGLLFLPQITFASLLYNQPIINNFQQVAYSFPQYAAAQTFTTNATGTISSIDLVLTKIDAGSTGCARGVIYSVTGIYPDLELSLSNNCIEHDDISIKPQTSTTTFIFPFTVINNATTYAIGVKWEGSVPLSGDNVQIAQYNGNPTTGYYCGLFGSWACNNGSPQNDFYWKIWGYTNIRYDETISVLECDTFDAGCYFSKAISWAFTLPDGAFDDFITLKDELKDRAPFGYFTAAANALGGFSTSTAAAFVLDIPTPIMENIFDPLRTSLVVIMFVAGLIWLYKRLTNIVI